MRKFLFGIIIFSTAISALQKISIGGVTHTSIGWLLPVISCLIYFILKIRIKYIFPVKVWIPWFILILIYSTLFPGIEGFQRFIMMFSPILIGIVFSSLKFNPVDHLIIVKWLKVLTIYLVLFRILASFSNMEINVPGVVMTAVLIISYFISLYLAGEKKYLIWIFIVGLVPVLGLNRMAILASFTAVLFTFSPFSLKKRIIIVLVLAVSGFFVFNSMSFQQKMFYSGSGSLNSFVENIDDIRTHGRLTIWIPMIEEIREKPVFGHGHDQSTVFISNILSWIRHPHNDYLRILFDYGFLGLSVYLITIIEQIRKLLKRSKESTNHISKLYLLFGASSFIPYLFLMSTGNAVLYVAYFGNLQFALIGIGYSLYKSETQPNENFIYS